MRRDSPRLESSSYDGRCVTAVRIFLFVSSVYVLYYTAVYGGKNGKKSDFLYNQFIDVYRMRMLSADSDGIMDVYAWRVCNYYDLYSDIILVCVSVCTENV